MKGTGRYPSLAFAALTLAACATPRERAINSAVQDAFWYQLTALCGRSYAGKLAPGSENGPFDGRTLVLRIQDCSAREIRAPFHVGDDHSRTWVFTREGDGLRLKHDHRREDGTSEPLSMYGGDSAGLGTPVRQTFPADVHSKSMFARDGVPEASANVWSVALTPGKTLTYGLERPGRKFRVDFDLTKEAPAPPPAWGATSAD